MRVAVVDIGTNSTRLLIADVDDGRVAERDRRSLVTRLGDGVDAAGALADEAQDRVFAALEDYAAAIEWARCDARVAVMTSAVRDASNGARFGATVAGRYGLDARTLSGDEEARLTFLGATASAPPAARTPLLVVDIGGGSTELVVGHGRGAIDFHVSTQVGVVRHSERFLHEDPPRPAEIAALRADVAAALEAAVPAAVRSRVSSMVAVAGTPTQSAAMDLELEPYDPDRVEGHRLALRTLDELLDRVAAVPLVQRCEIRGLDPARAPTIVAGIVVLATVLRAFGLDETRVSERDILWGVALATAQGGRAI